MNVTVTHTLEPLTLLGLLGVLAIGGLIFWALGAAVIPGPVKRKDRL